MHTHGVTEEEDTQMVPARCPLTAEHGMPRWARSRASNASGAESAFRPSRPRTAEGKGDRLPLTPKGSCTGRMYPRTECTINATVTHLHLRAARLKHTVAEINRTLSAHQEGGEVRCRGRQQKPTNKISQQPAKSACSQQICG
jgi:hypothetical protein